MTFLKNDFPVWFWEPNIKCWSWPVLAKPINVVLVILKGLKYMMHYFFTSLAIKGSIHLANFAIANFEQVFVQGLLHTLGQCRSRRHWNNRFWLVHYNNNKEFYLMYFFISMCRFSLKTLNSNSYFSNELEKICSYSKKWS